MHTSRIVELSSLIHEHTVKVDNYLHANNLPLPSFDASSSAKINLPSDLQASQETVLESLDELNALMSGPARFVAGQPV